MILSNLEVNGSLLLGAEGQSKTVTVLTDTSAVPYSAYYDMPDGFVTWLTIVTTDNSFRFTAENNLFNNAPRTVRVRLHCQPTFGGQWESKTFDVTQAADGLSVTFTPATITLATAAKHTTTVTVAGLGQTEQVTFSTPSWITAELVSNTQLDITAAANPDSDERSATVQVLVSGRVFYIPVTQAANDTAITFDTAELVCDHTEANHEVGVSGLPVGGATVSVSGSWLTATLAGTVLTVAVKENKGTTTREGSVTLTASGREFVLPVRQVSASVGTGRLVIDTNSFLASSFGDSVVVTAIEMPSSTDQLRCTVNIEGLCVSCDPGTSFIKVVQLANDKIELNVDAQNVFEGVERVATIRFEAGGATTNMTLTQSAPPSVYRLKGHGDKFVKKVSSASMPTALAEPTAVQQYDRLKVQDWVGIPAATSPTLVSANWDDVVDNPNRYDAYKTGYAKNSSDGSTVQKIAMGAVSYRFQFDPTAYGQVLRGLSFFVRSDGYCVSGLRISLEITDDDTPTQDWAVVREGSGVLSRHRAAQRVYREADRLYYGATQNVVFDSLNVTVSDATKIYLYVTMEDYKGVVGGNVYGSGIVVPSFEFYADSLQAGLTADDVITVTEVPTEPVPYVASGVRFLRRYDATTLTPVVAAPATSMDTERRLYEQSWRMVRKDLFPIAPALHADIPYHDPKVSDWFDTYYACNEHNTEGQKMHRSHAGMACYRITVPGHAVGLDLLSLKVIAVSDNAAKQGLRVAVALSDWSEPSEDTLVVREGSAFASGVSRHTSGDTPAVVTIPMPKGSTLETFIYVYVSLEERPEATNGWLDGSGYLTPSFELLLAEPIPDFQPMSFVGGGYMETGTPEMLLSDGEIPANFSFVPYREIASIAYDMWEEPPLPSRLELSFNNKWVNGDASQFVVEITSLPDNVNEFSITSELPSWITATVNVPARKIQFSVSALAAGMTRSTDITISSGEDEAILHIDQQGDEITYLAVTPSTISFPRAGGTSDITVLSLPNGVANYNCTVTPTAAWLQTSVSEDVITLTAAAQDIGNSSRQTTVRITAGSATKDVTVTQERGETKTYLVLSSNTANVSYEGGSGTVDVLSLPNGGSMAGVTITGYDSSWLTSVTLNQTTGRITWVAALNNGEARQTTVYVSSVGAEQELLVTQGANPSTTSIYPESGAIGHMGGTLTATLTVPNNAGTPSWSSNDGLTATITGSGNTRQVTITVPPNTNPPRTRVGTIMVVAGGAYYVTFTVNQGGVQSTGFTTKLAKITSEGLHELGPGLATKETGITSMTCQDDILVLNGTFVDTDPYTGVLGRQYICLFDMKKNKLVNYSTADEQPEFTWKTNLNETLRHEALPSLNYMMSIKSTTTLKAGGLCAYVYPSTTFDGVYGTTMCLFLVNYKQPTSYSALVTNAYWVKFDKTSNLLSKPVAGGGYDHLRTLLQYATNCPINDVNVDYSDYRCVVTKYYGNMAVGLVKLGANVISGAIATIGIGEINDRGMGYIKLNPLSNKTFKQGTKIGSVVAHPNGGIFIAGTGGVFATSGNLLYISDLSEGATSNYSSVGNNTKIPPTTAIKPLKNSKVDFEGVSMAFDKDGHLVIGGSFTNILGAAQPIKYLARWNNNGWEPYKNITLNGPVTAITRYGDDLIIAGDWSEYSRPVPPIGGLDMTPPLQSIDLDETQIVYGVRDMYAQAFADRIEPFDTTDIEHMSRQVGVCASLSRGGQDDLRLNLSALLAHLEVPQTFSPAHLHLTPPSPDILRVPEGTHVTLTAWWAANSYMGLEDISAVSNKASFWSGSVNTLTGERSVPVGQTMQKLKASMVKVGSITLDGTAWSRPVITMPVYGITGLYGTLLLSAWINVDSIARVLPNSAYGVGLLDVRNLAHTAENCWRPQVKLAP